MLHEQPPALAGGGTVAGLDRIIHKALQKAAIDRYPTARAIADAVRALSASPVSSDATAATARAMTRLVALAVFRAEGGERLLGVIASAA